MEDMAVVVSYVHDGDHVESDDSVESNLDQYESVKKKLCVDHYEAGYRDSYGSDNEEFEFDDDISSVDSLDCEYGPEGNKLSVEELKKIKSETQKKFEAWSATIKDEDRFALFDTTGACALELDAAKLKLTNLSLLLDLAVMYNKCRRRMTIYTFTHPGEDCSHLDGGGTRVHESSELSDLKLQRYSTILSKVIQQYNDIVTNKHSDSKLEFVSFTRCAYIFPNSLYITFIACQNGNGQIGTYQAAVADDFFDNEVQLVLLRHVEADKILAILSLTGVDEDLKKRYHGNWNF